VKYQITEKYSLLKLFLKVSISKPEVMISVAVHGSNPTHRSSKREKVVLELTGLSAGRD